ncbi:MAG TPA: alpha/beta hydrolase, partial [Gemmatimonadaceae bacterium]|nr:alpha/beta hydrolase [Gemmatimonadaceae bacterium]
TSSSPGGREHRVAMGLVAVVAAAATIAAATGIRQGGSVAPMTTTGTVTSDDGTAIAFTRLGHGPALVLVDGALCFRQNGPSRDIAPLLASHFTVYAYDRRGRGESGDTRPYAMARELEDLNAVIRETGDSAFVFGSSSGAALAMQGVAAGLPIRKLVLYEPPLGESRPGGPSLEESRRQLEALVASGDRAGAVRYFLATVFGAPRAFVIAMPVLMPRTWAKTKSVAHTLPYDFAILGDRSVLAERAKAIGVPTLVVGGGKSPAFLQRAVESVARALPNARAVLLPGQSHDASAAAKALTPVLTDFFAESARSNARELRDAATTDARRAAGAIRGREPTPQS